MILIAIFVACGLGSLSRYAFSSIWPVQKEKIPWATLTINLLACFLLGYLSRSQLDKGLYLTLGTGFCGGLSTFSTLQIESYQLQQKPILLFSYWLLTYGLGWGLLILGQHLAS